MPFTLAHPAIVIPLTKYLQKWGVLSALIIGSMMPDFSYFLPFGVSRYETHSVLALFWYCLPVGLVLYYVYHTLFAPVLLSILPQRLKQRLDGDIALGRLPTANILAIGLSVLIGATTHIIWDLFTHPPHDLPLVLSSWMQIVLIKFDGYTLYVFRALQHSSTFLGFALIFYWTRQWYKNTPPTQQPSWNPPLAVQTFTRLIFIFVPTTSGLIAGYLSARHLIETSQSSFLFKAILALRDVIIYGGRYLLLIWVLLGIFYFVLRYFQTKKT